jgi:hypothetical protein
MRQAQKQELGGKGWWKMRTAMKNLKYSAACGFCLLTILLTTSSCMSVRLIADYDQKIDEGITALQRKTESFLVKLERTCQTPEGTYARNVSFYDDAKVDLSVLQVRVDALALNKHTSEQLKLLQNSFTAMEEQHQKNAGQGFTAIVVAETRKILDTQFTSILALEIAKKDKLPSKN